MEDAGDLPGRYANILDVFGQHSAESEERLRWACLSASRF
jgi:hypothetical protein